MFLQKPIGILLVCTVVAIGCGQHSHSNKKIFRYNESSGITSLDPLKATNLSNIWAVQQVYEGLLIIDSLGNLQPLLATHFEVNDSLDAYSFFLKNNVYFHEDACFQGKKRKFNAYDVVYSYQRLLASSSSWILKNVDVDSNTLAAQIDIIDSFQLVIHLKQPSATFPQMLTMPPCCIVPKEAIEMYQSDVRRHPVGTGPFIFHTWYENEKLIFHRNPHYHISGLPKIDAISISFLKDKQTALLEFIRGNFDFISGIDAAYKDELLMGDGSLNPKYKNRVQLVKQPYLNTEYLGIRLDSTLQSPLQNLHIRKALNYGLDRNRLIKYIRNGVGIAGNHGIVPPVLYRNIDSSFGYQYNKKLFQQEIYSAGFQRAEDVPSFKLSTDVAYADICTYIIHSWNELGFHVSLDVMDRPTLKSEVAKGNLEFFRASWIADYPDAENYLSLFYGPLKSPAGPNYTHFKNDDFDLSYSTCLALKSDSLRNIIYQNLDRQMMEESPIIVLFYDQVVRFINRRVKNLPSHPMNYLDLRNVNIN